jgi:flagellum-specific peptidoglycan hydrolase FlgJ
MKLIIFICTAFIAVSFVRFLGNKSMPETSVLSEDIPTINIEPKQMGFVPQIGQKKTNTQAYINRFKLVAVSEMKKFGIPASITLAQGILESANGNSELSRKHNNHFGIKCKSRSQKCVTYADDMPDDQFRVFKSAWYSYREHSILLSSSPRYRSLFKLKKTDYRGWAKGLQKCGYATSKRYAKSLIRIIEKNNLQRFDNL